MNSLFLIVPILLPLAGGLAILLLQFKTEKSRMIFTETVAVLTSACVLAALLTVNGDPVDVYSFTNGFSVTFCLDGLGKLFAGMVAVMWPLVLLYAFEYMEKERRQNVFFAFYTMTYGVTLGVAFSADIVTMYLFFEMLTLVTIPLVAHYGTHDSLFAARKYAAYTIGGASLSFMAVVLTTVYGNAGAFLYGGSIGGDFDPVLMQIAFALGFFGMGAKAAVFPLHDWLPTASVAPTPVTALLHAVAVVNSGAFAVMRLTWYVFGTDFLMGTPVQMICIATAEFTLLFAAVKAIRERHCKRRLAYSTMSNLSYMLFGVMLMTPAGFTGAAAHMLFHGVIKITLFMVAGAFMHNTGYSYIYELNGVGRRMPVSFVCFTICAVSLTGIPPFCGFVSKWSLMTAGGESGTALGYAGVFCLIISAFLCAVYTLSISVRAFFPVVGKDRFREDSGVHEAGKLMLVPIVIFTGANLLLGIFSGSIMTFLEKIAVGAV